MFYFGHCDTCNHPIIWEPTTPDEHYASTQHVERNMMVIGSVLKHMHKTNVDHTKVTEKEVRACEELLGKRDSWVFSVRNLPFMSQLHVHNLGKLLDWVSQQIIL